MNTIKNILYTILMGLVFLGSMLIGTQANAQDSSALNNGNKVYHFSSTIVWKIESTYYIQIEHPVYDDVVMHTFTEETLRDIKKHSDEVMVDTHIYYSEFDYSTKNNKIVYKVGRQGKKHLTVLMFNNTDWIHGYSVEVRLDKLAKWIGIELN
mgnify:FL=1